MLKQGALFSGLLLLGPSWVLAQGGVTIDHNAVGCIVAGKFPRMAACFNPSSNVARARVYFRAEGGPHWYFVDMKSQMPCYQGVLPKPKKTIQKINYYVEVVDKAFAEARTAEYDPDVVPDEGACRKDVPAAPFLSNASVTVGSVAGAPVVPAGFAAAGIAGAGVSTTAVVVGVAAAGAATTGIVAASGGNTTTTATTQPGTTPTPTPPPQPSPTPAPPPTPPPSANSPPKAVFSVDPNPPQGPAPLTVKFSMCGSFDPDGDALEYFFDFGDGAKAQGGGCSAQHIYKKASLSGQGAAAGTYGATLTVTDNFPGHDQSKNYNVRVDCPKPSVGITAPSTRSTITNCPVLIKAGASDPTGIAYVEFFAEGYFGIKSLGVDSSPPYEAGFSPQQSGQFTLSAMATNSCGNTAEDSVQVDIFCGGYGYRQVTANVARRLSWTSQLDVPGGRGQVVLNGSAVSFPGAGRSMALGDAKTGLNRIEAQLVEGSGPGTWRFELGSALSLEAGSIRVVAGEVVTISADAIVFRLSGKAGERVAFAFKAKE